jgi:hypothetical protein
MAAAGGYSRPAAFVGRSVLAPFTVYFLGLLAVLSFQRMTSLQASALACRRSAGVASMVLLISFEMRASEMTTLVRPAGNAFDIELAYFETPGSEGREQSFFSADSDDNTMTISGEVFWISYRVRFRDATNYDAACFKRMFEKMKSHNI